jgi:tetratricopeptide (TPR) repeat protein
MSEQIPLFEDEYVLRNDAVGALIALNLDAALAAFQRHHDLYRDNDDIDKMMAVANFLQQGLVACPKNGPDRPGCLVTFWNSFENSMEATQAGSLDVISRIKLSFFHLLVQAVEEVFLPDSAYLSHRIPIGYAYLQIGRYDQAIRSLQTCLIATWLPSYAYIKGVFGPKQIRLKDEFITFIDGYLELKKACGNNPSLEQAAKLFLKSIVLCDNEPFLRMIKGIDFAEVRRGMKKANAPLFATYLRYIEHRK